MVKDEAIVQALDGGYILPRLEILRLSIVQDSEAKVFIQKKEFSQEKSQGRKARFEEEPWEELLRKMKDLTQKLKNSLPQEFQTKDTRKESVKEVLNQLKHLSEVDYSLKKPQ
ncbi:hypothetical protein O181_043502 [Austropuccinia psidii MF-1]|uniref:Uncharacterized protein n=1 Tax=Austropuccinia psidii MF-1 TaxID=1389203 RepID=A0A9Q3HGW4_9BASI|nr:hypothetical protein [Austropuccinia psidii MF-1]